MHCNIRYRILVLILNLHTLCLKINIKVAFTKICSIHIMRLQGHRDIASDWIKAYMSSEIFIRRSNRN